MSFWVKVVPLRGGAMMKTGSRTGCSRKPGNRTWSSIRPKATMAHMSQ